MHVGEPVIIFAVGIGELGEGEPGCVESIESTHSTFFPSINVAAASEPPTGNGCGGYEPCPDNISPSLA